MNIMFEKAERKTVSLLCECGGQSQRGCQQGETQQLRLMQKKKTAKKKSLLDTRLTPLGFVRQGERERKEKERDHCWERTPNSVNHCLTATKDGGGRGAWLLCQRQAGSRV